jgi:hypothetical protein
LALILSIIARIGNIDFWELMMPRFCVLAMVANAAQDGRIVRAVVEVK